MPDPVDETTARNRWMVITLLRLGGAVMAMFGIIIVSGNIDLPLAAGYVLVLIGLIDVFFVPGFLARKWRTPDQ